MVMDYFVQIIHETQMSLVESCWGPRLGWPLPPSGMPLR